ncbi:hypothetical protein ACF044_10190 [Microbacterium sp. NPDC016588]
MNDLGEAVPGLVIRPAVFVVTRTLLVVVLYVPLFSLTWTSFVATAV